MHNPKESHLRAVQQILQYQAEEVHKGRIGYNRCSKDDRSVDRCKSVNHLRSHKNKEIQKKARNLVDTWKKQVEDEMDAKSGSSHAVPWSARPRLFESSHSGSKHCASPEVAMKSSVTNLSA
ncbi:hypothetical protein V6N13_026885 [Hibiscus sabdariffa]